MYFRAIYNTDPKIVELIDSFPDEEGGEPASWAFKITVENNLKEPHYHYIVVQITDAGLITREATEEHEINTLELILEEHVQNKD
jgi:hypothetical protein